MSPIPLRSPRAELREKIAQGASRNEGTLEDEDYIKAFFFIDRLLFTSIKSRGGKRGQKGDSISTAVTRRIRLAWAGEWEKLWEDSASSPPNALGAKQTVAQQLARDVRAIQESLGDDDIRAALRVVDGRVNMASEAKAVACLPELFPDADLPKPTSTTPTPTTSPASMKNSPRRTATRREKGELALGAPGVNTGSG